jgi:Icc-related predicted phosphoesterase
MKIIATSDLHGHLPDIPECDLLIIAGDVCPATNHTLQYQYWWLLNIYKPWLGASLARDIVWIAGNHDFALQRRSEGFLDGFRGHYLQDGGVTIQGLKIWGTPWTPTYGMWAFMKPDDELRAKFGPIPKGLDILISHGPPLGVLDRNADGGLCGSKQLWRKVNLAKPKLHIFGHIHEGRGERTCDGIHYVNPSHVDGQYQPNGEPVDVSDLLC